MQASEREDFMRELGKLCAGFGVPLTKAREESYWAAFTRMSLSQFRRCVEHALGPDYDGDEMPRTGQIWKIYKGTAMVVNAAVKALPPEQDHLAYLANRLLWMHVAHRGGLGSTGGQDMTDSQASDELQRCMKFKRELVEQFCGFVREGDEFATPETFIRWWAGGLAKISALGPQTAQAYVRMAQGDEAQRPFPEYMARDMTPHRAEIAA